MKIVGKKKKAQQLIEFLLVAPFMVIILGILTEYAYALSINMTLSQGLKTTASSIYSEIKPGMSASTIRTTFQNDFKKYLSDNNVPTNAENNIQVGYAIVNQTAVFMASYTYLPAFTLPNAYFKFLPDKFNFFATAAVPAAFLKPNDYSLGINSRALDKIWSSSASFSTQDDFNASKKGIMKDNSSGGRSHMLFLVPTSAPGLATPYELVLWDGSTINNGSAIYTLDTSNGNLYECSATCNFKQKFFDYLTDNNNFYNIIFIHDAETPSVLSMLNTYWINPTGSTDLSDKNVNGILKRALALYDMGNSSVGNYDDSSANTYKVDTFGSMIFVYTAADNINKIKEGESPPGYNGYNFESENVYE